MKHFALLATALAIAACAKPAPDNVATANVADPDVTEVADDSAGANAATEEAEPGNTAR